MALVTLQRSPTPSAASTASTTTTNAGEVRLQTQEEMQLLEVLVETLGIRGTLQAMELVSEVVR